MELYIPPPASFMPRLPPPRPVVPAVPIVPPPELPEVIHAPEGPYTLTKELFPHIGTPAAPVPQADPRMMPPPSFMGGAGGFIVAPPPGGAQTGQTAMSFGSTVVNGQTQPAWPVKMSWVNVWFPHRGGGEKGFLGMSTGGATGGGQGQLGQGQGAPPMSPGFDDASSDNSSDMGSDQPAAPMPMEVPLSALPQGQTGKRMPFTRGQTISGANLPRPKNNLRSSNSTFVTRLQTYDGLLKMLQDRSKQGGEMARWGFWNLGRTVGWGEEGGKVKEPLSRVTFSQVPTCHTVSHLTASPDRLDMIVGFASGDLVWVDFLIGRYTRINKGGLLNSNAVVSVHFDPRQPHQFVAVFADAMLIQFNLFAEDPVLPPAGVNGQTMPWTIFFERQQAEQVPVTPTLEKQLEDQEKVEADRHAKGEVYEDAMIIWKNEDWTLNQPDKKRGQELSPWAGRNPTAAAKVGRGNITATAYSPDGRWLAVVSDDGMLRLIDVAEERLTDTFAGYFGGLSCIAWSPDSRFIAAGGQDDLITLISIRELRVAARCTGHSAFVTGICFDPVRGDGRGYRFGSVGEDGKLVLWDFTAASLHRPRHHTHHGNSSHHRLAAGSTLSLAGQSRSHLPMVIDTHGGRYHPPPPQSEVALLQPVMARLVEGNLLTGVSIDNQCVVTISRAAQVKFWQRPPRQVASKRQTRRLSTGAEKTLKNVRERDTAVAA